MDTHTHKLHILKQVHKKKSTPNLTKQWPKISCNKLIFAVIDVMKSQWRERKLRMCSCGSYWHWLIIFTIINQRQITWNVRTDHCAAVSALQDMTSQEGRGVLWCARDVLLMDYAVYPLPPLFEKWDYGKGGDLRICYARNMTGSGLLDRLYKPLEHRLFRGQRSIACVQQVQLYSSGNQ